MTKLKIEFSGGFNQVSKPLAREHDTNFATIVDALVNIYNMNIDNLVKKNGESSVRISNDFLSRNTGLGLYIVKSNIKKVEDVGLVTVIKKGKGNTRHYLIHIERINSYIKVLEVKFQQWFNNSLESSKKDKARSKEADKIKIATSLKNFEENMKMITTSTEKSPSKLVDNQPTKKINKNQPNSTKPTVVNITKEITIKTTTKSNIVVVDEIFDQTDSTGMFLKIEAYDRKVYKRDYEDYIAKHTKEDLERKFEEFEQQEFDYLSIEDGLDFDDGDKKKSFEAISKQTVTIDLYYHHTLSACCYGQLESRLSWSLLVVERLPDG